MAAVQSGSQRSRIRGEAAALGAATDAMDQRLAPPVTTVLAGGGAGQGGNMRASLGNDFPVQMVAPDDRDTVMAMKAQLVNDRGAIPGVGLATATDADFEWMKNKIDMLEKADFQQFADNFFDMSSPAEIRIVEEVYPEYFTERQKQIEATVELQKEIAEMRLHGYPRNRKQLFLAWYLSRSKKVTPALLASLNSPVHQPQRNASVGDTIKYGLFNPKRIVGATLGPASRRGDVQNAWADAGEAFPLLGGAQRSFRNYFVGGGSIQGDAAGSGYGPQ